MVDRISFRGNLLQIGTVSYSLAITQARTVAQDSSTGRRLGLGSRQAGQNQGQMCLSVNSGVAYGPA
ncbi:hypothetical protein ASE41_32650 [Streptomyces sp. Root264]|nr:hypothetical protein ASE41_32650 [Streptomyces sp. Root264]